MENIELIKENLNKINEKISKTCQECNRDVSEITVIAASKTRSKEVIEELVNQTEIKICGENKVQEFISKYDENDKIDWQFIGQLQTNKAKFLIGNVSLIHSVDSYKLAKKIDLLSERKNIVTNILIEVNMANEETKGGIKPEKLFDFINSLSEFKNIKICGIMSVLPNIERTILEQYYSNLQKLFNETKKIDNENCEIKYLSAGMSKDYDLAIKYGANIVRIGTALFGARNYNI